MQLRVTYEKQDVRKPKHMVRTLKNFKTTGLNLAANFFDKFNYKYCSENLIDKSL